MEKYLFMAVGIVFGIAVSLYLYAIKREYDIKRIKNDQEYYSTQKLDAALQGAVEEMQTKMKQLNRKLTEDEKNDIIFEHLNENEENKEQTINKEIK